MPASLHRRILATIVGLALVMNGSLLAARRPNVVLIMTDNHGAWTLGCYGNPDIRTPHIDQLAQQGVLFTRAFASNAVCSPTRATFLTGLVPSQHGVHCFLRGGGLQVGPRAQNTLAELTSLPEVLRDAGYTCGLVGKWHLGDNLNPQEGFDGYWITMPHGGTSTFYDAEVIEDGKIRKEPKYLTEFWTEHAVQFIEQNKNGGKPFFLFLAYNGPYSLSGLLLREGRNRHAAYYADKELPSFPREPTHPWQFANRDYINNPVSIRRVATEVSGVDDGVGTILESLTRHGLDRNTVVVFTADQGWVGGHGGFWGMGDHTRPLTAFDGMLRIPMIWRHPGRIRANERSDLLVSNYDFMPTMLSYLGLADKMPNQPKSPGRDFSPILVRQGDQPTLQTQWDNTVFYEFENTRAIRTDRWKYVHRHPNGPHELYDIPRDTLEENNLYRDPAHVQTRDQLKQRLDAFFDHYAEPKYDLWRGGTAQSEIHEGIDEELAQVAPVEPPALPENFEAPAFTVPEGYTVELVAGPPLVEHPLMANFDDRGRLFIAENAGLNLKTSDLETQLPNSIRMIEDTDGDGRFDRSTVFADKMTFPQGALWHDGALFVTSPPNLWRLEDTDGDGVADKREVLVDKFGYTGNAADIHGPFLGPDGRIYWCDGRHGHEFRSADGTIASKGEGSYIFSCYPDGSDVRAHCGGGMDNPVEVDFTDEGEVLGTVNILYRQPRNDCLVHWLYGGAYPHSEKVLGEFKRTGDLLGPVHKFGHVAVSGMTRYRSGVLDRSFQDNIFVTIFNTGKVLRCQLEREGATFRAAQHEFFSCASRDCHPTDVLEDADGSLLVIDTGGWFRIGCPTSQIAKPEIKGAIYRVRRQGMTPLVDPWGLQIDWQGLNHHALAMLLNDTRFKVRERAIAECAKRGDAIVPTLLTTVRQRDRRQRLNAVWALARIQSEKAKAAIRMALTDSSSSVRLAACHSIANTKDAQAASTLMQMVRQDKPAVRREAATALGRLGGNPETVEVLLEALGRDIDRSEEHALIYALIQIDDATTTAKGLDSHLTKVRRAALIALDQMDNGRLTSHMVAPLLLSDDQLLRLAALDVFRRRSQWAADALRLLDELLKDDATTEQRATIVEGLTVAFTADERIGQLIGRTLLEKDNPARWLMLSAMSQAASVSLHESWVAPLTTLLDTADEQSLERTIAAVAAIDTDRFDEKLKQIAANQDRPILVRVAALEAISGRTARLSDAAFALLAGLLEPDAAPVERLRAAQIVGASQLTRQQLAQLVPQLQTAGPLELRELIKPYEGNTDAQLGKSFVAAVEESPGFWNLLPSELWHKVHRCPPEVAELAVPLVDKLQQQEDQKQNRLSELHPLLGRGNPESGQTVFASEKAKCAVCHRVGQNGGQIGPDLSQVGRIRGGRDLLEAILFPSTSFVREYQPYTVITTDGKVQNGIISRETKDTLYLQTQIGSPIIIPRDKIEDIAPSTISIMPQGIDRIISQQELSDLIAYLMSLK